MHPDQQKTARAAARPLPSTHTQPSTNMLRSTQLFAGERTVCIEHAGQIYYLRITRENKLILTK